MPDTATAPPDNSNAQADWEATAQQPDAQTQAPAPVETQNAPQSTQTLPETQTPGYNVPEAADRPADTPSSQAVTITPVKRGGLLGVMDSVADALTGKTRPEIGTDQDGNKYVKSTSLSRGEQWERIAGTAIAGAAKGMAAGRGRGNLGAAAAAGVDEGQKIQQGQQQQQKDMSEEARQQNLEAANHQLLVQKQAEHALTMKNLEIQGTQQQIKFAQEQEDRYDAKGTYLGHMSSHGNGQLAEILQKDPDVMKALVQDGTIKTPIHYDENGKADGFSVYRMPPDFSKQLVPPGTKFHTFDPETHQLVEHNASDGMTQGQLDAYEMVANNQMAKYSIDTAKLKETEANTNKANADAEKAKAEALNAPLEAGKIRADTSLAWNNSAKSSAETKAILDKAAQAKDPALIDEIGTGKMDSGRLSYLMARNPDLLQAVAEKYPGFDSSKVAGYANTYKEFTSSKPGTAGAALNNGATALKHLKELQEMNTPASMVYGTKAYRAYQDKAESVSSELAKFYGNTSLPAIEGIKSQLVPLIPVNRGTAISTQAQSMGDKLDSYEQTWKNAAPSSAYEAPMPGIDEKAIEARAALDPQYRQRLTQQPAPGAQPQQAKPVATPPPGATGQAKGSDGKMHWADASGKDYGVVQ